MVYPMAREHPKVSGGLLSPPPEAQKKQLEASLELIQGQLCRRNADHSAEEPAGSARRRPGEELTDERMEEDFDGTRLTSW